MARDYHWKQVESIDFKQAGRHRDSGNPIGLYAWIVYGAKKWLLEEKGKNWALGDLDFTSLNYFEL